MTAPDFDAPEEVTWQGDWITAKKRGRWEYCSRAHNIRAAVILAVENGEIILVEQYRVPLGQRSLELPAGLIGDDDGGEDDDPLSAAKRELLEETGYEAEHWEEIGEFFSSPGMVSESFTLLKATGLKKTGPGGGVGGEDIAVHRVKLSQFPETLKDFRRGDVAIDTRMLLALGPHLLGDL
ncbi:NUDIX hydrolase [Aurantiacibacter sp. MUD61]|uniref:NUDIX hydrolase n=1 Tax=Aurantiacibacter sp. MUD61 TaxID=3009083 RepID=UPI0022F10B07|nr:NUDIX hydrolase [Aurantiacibacter sp. MUD61]